MKNLHWIAIGAVVGVGSGAIFGWDYMIAGAGIGVVAGTVIALVLR